jgi:hypothetical protein
MCSNRRVWVGEHLLKLKVALTPGGYMTSNALILEVNSSSVVVFGVTGVQDSQMQETQGKEELGKDIELYLRVRNIMCKK